MLPSFLCTAMMRLGTRMAAVFDQHFARMNMTQAQFRTLLMVLEQGDAGGITPSDLAEHLLLERATVTSITNRLVEAGHLERRPGANRRTHYLVLTPSGRACLETVFPHATALADWAMGDTSMEEMRTFAALLQRLEQRIRSYTPPEGTDDTTPEER